MLKKSFKSNDTQEEANSKTLAYLFLFWPLVAFIIACSDVKQKFNRTIILLFFFLYGLLFVLNPLMDGTRRADKLKEVYERPFSEFYDTLKSLFIETTDFVEPLLMYFVSRITNSHHVFFGVLAVIFGILFLLFFKRFAVFYYQNPNQNSLLFLWIMAWVNPIFNINGFRMWTAAWVFSLGVLYYLLHKKKVYLLVAGLSVFIHFSYIPIFIVLCCYILVGNKPFLYAIMAIVSFFIVELDIAVVREYASFLGPVFEKEVTAYTHDKHIENVAMNKTNEVWFMQLGPKLFLYFLIVSMFYMYKNTKGYFDNKFLESLFSITLLFLSFSNIAALLPSGGRFRVIFYTFSAATLLVYYAQVNYRKKLTVINRIGLPIALLMILISFRIGTETISPFLLGPSFLLFGGFFDLTPLKDILF